MCFFNINFTKSGSNNNTNENEENENEKKINVKPPSSDNKIYIDIKKSKDDEKIEFNDDMLAQIITKKRNSFSHSSKNKSNAYRNTIINRRPTDMSLFVVYLCLEPNCTRNIPLEIILYI